MPTSEQRISRFDIASWVIAGLLLKNIVTSNQIVGSHPRLARREELHDRYAIEMFEHNRDAAEAVSKTDSVAGSIIILGIKPQRLGPL